MKKKMKLTPMPWNEVERISFSEKQWKAINAYLKLSSDARNLIEANASLYRFHQANHAGYPTRSAAQAELKKIEELAKRLSHVLKNMNERTFFALVDTTENVDWRKAREIWCAHMKNLDAMVASAPQAQDIVLKQKRGKSGPNSFALDHLVEQLDGILYRYKKINLDRRKTHMNFVRAIVTTVDPDIRDGAIDAAIKRAVKQRPDRINR